jgi:hypothetical protein
VTSRPEPVPASPSVSIVVEWANLTTIEIAQARERLTVLRDQLALYPGKLELIFAFPADDATEAQVRRLVEELELAHVLYARSDKPHYYQLKNAGALRASGELVVFVDCDVFVEPRWLESLVRPFADPAVEVVCGATHLGPLTSFWARCVALCWIYDPRSDDNGLIAVRRFWSHSVAFRRTTFLRHPFPDEPRYRGADATLAEALLAQGIGIWRAGGARTIHPPPAGLGAFLARAVHAGTSYATGASLQGRRPGLVDSVRNVAGRLRRAATISIGRHREVGLGWVGGLSALGLGTLYWGTAWVSYLVAALRGNG